LLTDPDDKMAGVKVRAAFPRHWASDIMCILLYSGKPIYSTDQDTESNMHRHFGTAFYVMLGSFLA